MGYGSVGSGEQAEQASGSLDTIDELEISRPRLDGGEVVSKEVVLFRDVVN